VGVVESNEDIAVVAVDHSAERAVRGAEVQVEQHERRTVAFSQGSTLVG
jgi:hypothetical protein